MRCVRLHQRGARRRCRERSFNAWFVNLRRRNAMADENVLDTRPKGTIVAIFPPMVGGHGSRQKRQYSPGAPSRTWLAGVRLPAGARGPAGSGARQALWCVRLFRGNSAAIDGDGELTFRPISTAQYRAAVSFFFVASSDFETVLFPSSAGPIGPFQNVRCPKPSGPVQRTVRSLHAPSPEGRRRFPCNSLTARLLCRADASS